MRDTTLQRCEIWHCHEGSASAVDRFLEIDGVRAENGRGVRLTDRNRRRLRKRAVEQNGRDEISAGIDDGNAAVRLKPLRCCRGRGNDDLGALERECIVLSDDLGTYRYARSG